MAKVITARLDHDIDKNLALIAKTEHLDRSTVMRRLLSKGLAEWRKDRAMEKYKKGQYSAEQAATFAKVGLWTFFDILRKNNVVVNYDLEELEEDVLTIKLL
jgi:predicted HTH domain antitoxin